MLQGLWRVKRDYDTEYESMAERGIFFVQRRTAISTTSHRDSGCTVQSVCKGTIPQEWNNKTVAIVGTPLFRLWQISGREDRRKACCI